MNLIVFANAVIVLFTAVSTLACFRKDGKWSLTAGFRSFRFFTLLSNVLCAIASLLILLCLNRGIMPYGVWLLK